MWRINESGTSYAEGVEWNTTMQERDFANLSFRRMMVSCDDVIDLIPCEKNGREMLWCSARIDDAEKQITTRRDM